MTNYGGIPEPYCNLDFAKIVVLPIPYDGTSTWGKGADRGPEALLEASANMELYDIETNSEVYLQGIYTAPPVVESSSPEKMTEVAYEATKKYLSMDKFMVSIGGEHSVSIGPAWAHIEKFEDVSVLQIDAHTDLRPEYDGTRFNHACVMARIRERCPIVQVGIRSMDTVELPFVDNDRVFYAKDIVGRSHEWMEDVLGKLTRNVYLTVDLDGFDPSILPATGTPEPGGLSYYDVINLVKKVVAQKNLVGMDVVELAPISGNRASQFLATKLIYQILSHKFNK
jgi:agmatinase